jgi:hypothetical protein
MPIVHHEKKTDDALRGKLFDCSERIVVERVNAGQKPSGRAEALPHSAAVKIRSLAFRT